MNGKREADFLKGEERTFLGKSLALQIALGGAFSAVAFFLGKCEMVFSSYPLGFALLSASAGLTPFVLLGLVFSCFAGEGVAAVRLCAYALLVAIRLFCRLVLDAPEKEKGQGIGLFEAFSLLFSENTYLRMMSAGIGVFLVGVYNIVAGGFRFYDLFGTVFYIVTAPVATLLFSPFFDVLEEKKRIGSAPALEKKQQIFYDVSCIALICSLVYSLAGTSTLGLSLSVLVAGFASLYYSRHGYLKAIVAGLFIGLAVSPAYAPLFALASLVCALLRQISLLAGCVGACIVGIIWGIYVEGAASLAFVFPALLSASALYFTAQKLNFFADISSAFEKRKEKEKETHEELGLLEQSRASASIEKIKGISNSFSELSEIFYNLSSKLSRPAMLDLRHICDKTFDEYCPDCDDCDTCWGIEYSSMLDDMRRISSSIHTSGKAELQKLSVGLKERCLYLPSIVDDINSRCAKATKEALFNEKTEIFALDYESVSKILNDAIKENELDYKVDRALSKKAGEVIEGEGYGKRSVTVYGSRSKTIIAKGLNLSENASGAEKLRRSLESSCGLALEEPVFFLAMGSVNMRCETKKRFFVESAASTSPSLYSGDVCGDSVSTFENKNNYFYSLISDGMGTGQNAAFTSEMCNVFLRNMLLAGNKAETSIRMLNSVIRAKAPNSEMECSATLDLFELDAYTGSASIIKSGAAPTYLLRAGNVFKLSAKSIPIGIIKNIDAKQIELKCLYGDVIVMVSDGVSKSDGECAFLPDLLKYEWDDNLSVTAEKITKYAREKEKSTDDISVIIMKIKEDS